MGNEYFLPKRPQYYWIERVYTELVIVILPFLKARFITPNMVTGLNLVLVLTSACWCVWNRDFVATAFLIQLYLFLDILDGNLARYKKMCTPFGKRLDESCDYLFYSGFYAFLGYRLEIGIPWIVAYLVVFNLYGAVATFYIVPRIRKIGDYKRSGIKKYFMERGFIFGMDNGMQNVLASILLFTPFAAYAFYISIALYLLDMAYRLKELNMNMVMQGEAL